MKKTSRKTNRTSKKKYKSKQINGIKLLKHQLAPLDYFVAKCKDQHGLIVNHYMGSGKTITGLAFFMNYPKDKKIIVCPKGLESIWLQELKKFPIDPKNITFINYEHFYSFEMLIELFNNAIVIMDEVHNLYQVIYTLRNAHYNELYADQEQTPNNEGSKKPKKQKIDPRFVNFIRMLYTPKKLLLMSGTLILSESVSEIRWLINIAAAKKEAIVPYDADEFYQRYIKFSREDIAYIKVLRPFLSLNPLNIIPDKYYKLIPFQTGSLMSFIMSLFTTGTIQYLSSNRNTELSNANKKLMKTGKLIEPTDESHFSFVKTKFLNFVTYTNFIVTKNPMIILKVLAFTLILKCVPMVFRYLKERFVDRYDYERLNVEKLKDLKVNRYFSYFNYKNTNDPNYPTFKEYLIRTSYTQEQIKLLIKMLAMPENMTFQELVDLEIYRSIGEAELYYDTYLVFGKFREKGPLIGNMYDNPNKFKEIVKIYKQENKPSTVVYSISYESGILLFSKYLKRCNIEHTILDHNVSAEQKADILNAFFNKEIKMLLLHPDFYQGINIKGAKYLHILEPIASLPKREQLYARVIRYQSHTHLPVNERKVYIVNWSCTLSNDIKTLVKSKFNLIDEWFKVDRIHRHFVELIQYFNFVFSPDDLIITRYDQLNNFSNDFYKSIKDLSIDNSKLESKCCIWGAENCIKSPCWVDS